MAIISASAPALRPLFRKTTFSSSCKDSLSFVPRDAAGAFSAQVSSRDSQLRFGIQTKSCLYYEQGSSNQDISTGEQCSAGHATEDSMIGNGESGIKKTTDVQVEFE